MPTYNNFAQTTVVTLYKNCPCDRDYNHTVHFNSLADQSAYFASLPKMVLTSDSNKQSFQRATINSVRVNIPQWSVREYNYMCFNNGSAMGSKNYYCFVDRTEYINPNTTEVFYTEDVMQTWMFEYTFEQCFVEREHSPTDTYGENLLAEPVDLGPYYQSNTPDELSGSFVVALACTGYLYYDTNEHSVETVIAVKQPNGSQFGGCPTGCALAFWDFNHIDTDYNPYGSASNPDPWNMIVIDNVSKGRPSFTEFVSIATAKWGADSILGAYIIPYESACAPNTPGSATNHVYNLGLFDNVSSGATLETGMGSAYAWNFTPKNKKLYTYPYCYFNVYSGDTSKDYRYEAFVNHNTLTFHGRLVPTPDACSLLIPLYYKGQYQNREESICISGYPILSVNIDSFKAWWAQNRGQILASLVSTGIGGLASTAMNMNSAEHMASAFKGYNHGKHHAGHSQVKARMYEGRIESAEETGLINVASGELNNITGAIISGAQAGSLSNGMVGNSSGTVQYRGDLMTIRACAKFILPYYAHMADEFFSMFGYATKRVKIPNITSRPRWNYIKTSNCQIKSSYTLEFTRGIDAETKETICSIYNKGITFWHYRQDMDIGNYSLDNSPT